MLGLQVDAPGNLVVELVVVLLQFLDGIRIGDAAEVGRSHVLQALDQALVDELVEEGHLLGRIFENIVDDVFQHVLGQFHVVLEVSEGDLGLDHPELRRMPGRVGILRPEGGTEGVDFVEGHGEGLAVELAGNRQVCGPSEKVLRIINASVGILRRICRVNRRDPEHLAGALCVRPCNQGRMNIDKVPLLEKFVNGIGSQRPHPEDRLEGIGPGPQVGDGPQVLHRVPFGLQGIVGVRRSFDRDLIRLQLERLLGVGGQGQDAARIDGRSDIEVGRLGEIRKGVMIYDLKRSEKSSVV